MNIQAPPNLSPGALRRLIAGRHQRLGRRVAGDARPRQSRSAVAASRRARARDQRGRQDAGRAARDLSALRRATRERWVDPALRTPLLQRDRRRGLAARRRLGRRAPQRRMPRERDRAPAVALPARDRDRARSSTRRARRAAPLERSTRSSRLFAARGDDFARRLRAPPTRCARDVNGDTVTYVVNRNINYTNICYLSAASSARSPRARRARTCAARPTTSTLDEIERRAREAWERGATEVCMQGGIHPELHRRRPISRSAAP